MQRGQRAKEGAGGGEGAGRDSMGGIAWPWGPCSGVPVTLLCSHRLQREAEDEGRGAGDKDTTRTRCHRVLTERLQVWHCGKSWSNL